MTRADVNETKPKMPREQMYKNLVLKKTSKVDNFTNHKSTRKR